MTFRKECVKTHEDGEWEYGKTYVDGEFVTDWTRLKKELWVSKKPRDYLADFHLFVDDTTATVIENIIDGDASLLYWAYGISSLSPKHSEIFVKLLLGQLPREAKNRSVRVNEVLPKEILEKYVSGVVERVVPSSKTKEFFEELLLGSSFEEALKNEKFNTVSEDFTSSLVDSVIEKNKEQFSKIVQNPQLINWFVGQVMKESKGKASPEVVKNMLEERL